MIDRTDTRRPATAGSYTLRPPAVGDLGWIVYRNSESNGTEFGFDETYEAMVARIVADYAGDHDPACEAAWIAEVDGQRAGCVLCVRKDAGTAQLRLLLVDPVARGRGVGAGLVDACVEFARRAGYGELVLWTVDVLTRARRVYERAGFELVEAVAEPNFGCRLVGQTWRREL